MWTDGLQSAPIVTFTPGDHVYVASFGKAVVREARNDAILSSLTEVRVIHGRSGGRLKAAVHARLRALPSVRSFRVDPANPGTTLVTL